MNFALCYNEAIFCNNNKEYQIVILHNFDLHYYTGYVGVTKDHEMYGIQYDNKIDKIDSSPESFIKVYRGLTYSGNLDNKYTNKSMWFFGFDTFHRITYTDKWLIGNMIHQQDMYSTLQPDYELIMAQVLDECNSLMKQLQLIDQHGLAKYYRYIYNNED